MRKERRYLKRPARLKSAWAGVGIVDQMRPLQMQAVFSEVTELQRGVATGAAPFRAEHFLGILKLPVQ